MDDMTLVYNIHLCRICQIPTNLDLVDTSTTAENGESYWDLLKYIFNDIVWIQDQLISLACKLCLGKIQNVAEFKKICVQTNSRRALINLYDIKVNTKVFKDETNDEKTNSDLQSSVLRKKRKGDQIVSVPKLKKLKMYETKKSKVKKKKKYNRTKPNTHIKTKIYSDGDETDEDDLNSKLKAHDKDVEKFKIETNSQDVSSSQINDQPSPNEKICRVCKRKLPSYKKLKKHTKVVHPRHLFYHCDMCEETFPTKDYWERHEFKHNGIKKYVCTFCGAKYITRSDLTHHTDTHKEYAKYACTICPGKMFQTSNSLTKHKMLVHTDHKDYKHLCTECGMKFGMISGLRVHLLRHANIRKFSCHLCDKTFCTSHELKSHSVSHSNVRPFKCDLCTAEYKLKSVLLKHKSKVHGIGNYKHAVPKKFICSYCSKTVSSKCKLLRHIRTHTGVKPFKCRLCDTKFTCKSYVKGHVKGKHNIDVYASDFNVKSYFDTCEPVGTIPNEDTSGLVVNTEHKDKINV